MMGVLAMIVYIGCYTDETHTNGLYACEIDAETGAISSAASYAVPNPLYFARSGDVLYTTCTEGLASFRSAGAKLTPIDRVHLGGKGMCHLAVDRNSTRLNSSHRLLSRMPSSA